MFVRALEKLGFTVRRQHGSHIIMRRDDPFAQTVVPNHRQIDRGILRQTEITADNLLSCSDEALDINFEVQQRVLVIKAFTGCFVSMSFARSLVGMYGD